MGIIYKRLFWIDCHRIPRLHFPANLDNQIKSLFFLPQIKKRKKEKEEIKVKRQSNSKQRIDSDDLSVLPLMK